MAHPTDLTGHGGGRSHADGAAERGTGPSPLGGLLGRVPRLDRLRTGAEADRPQACAGFAGGLDLLRGVFGRGQLGARVRLRLMLYTSVSVEG